MVESSARSVLRALSLVVAFSLAVWGLESPAATGQSVTPSEEALVFYTAEWEGPRYECGRPKVPESLLRRMEKVTIEQAWGVLRENGYHNQYAGDWKKIHEDRPVVGRALTAQYMPRSPGLEEPLSDGAGYFEPTPEWNEKESWDRTWS